MQKLRKLRENKYFYWSKNWYYNETSTNYNKTRAYFIGYTVILIEYGVKFISSFVTVETLYSTIYYSKYFTELHIDKSTQYVAPWTHKRHPIPRGRAMECLLWVLQQKLIVL